MLSLIVPSPSTTWKYISRSVMLRGEKKAKAFDSFPRLEVPAPPRPQKGLQQSICAIFMKSGPSCQMGAKKIQSLLHGRHRIRAITKQLEAMKEARILEKCAGKEDGGRKKRALWRLIDYSPEEPSYNCRNTRQSCSAAATRTRRAGKSQCAMWKGWREENPFRSVALDDGSLFLCEFYEQPTRWFRTLFSMPLRTPRSLSISKIVEQADRVIKSQSPSIGEGVEFVHVDRADDGSSAKITLCGTFHVFAVRADGSFFRPMLPHVGSALNPEERSRVMKLSPKCLSIPPFEDIMFTHMHATRCLGYKWFESEEFLRGLPPIPLVLSEPETCTVRRQNSNDEPAVEHIVIASRLALEAFPDVDSCVSEVVSHRHDLKSLREKMLRGCESINRRKGSYACAIVHL